MQKENNYKSDIEMMNNKENPTNENNENISQIISVNSESKASSKLDINKYISEGQKAYEVTDIIWEIFSLFPPFSFISNFLGLLINDTPDFSCFPINILLEYGFINISLFLFLFFIFFDCSLFSLSDSLDEFAVIFVAFVLVVPFFALVVALFGGRALLSFLLFFFDFFFEVFL